ncbi:hypothetical protein ACO0QE_002262 [Hanseniaspora vineae]
MQVETAVSNAYHKCIDHVFQLPNIGRAKLKYVGAVQNKQGVFCGFDLLTPMLGKNDGSVDGVSYFQCEFERSGLFVQFTKVKSLLDGYLQKLNMPETELRRSTTPTQPIPGTPNPNKDRIAKLEQDVVFLNKLVQDQSLVIEEAQPIVIEYDEKVKHLEKVVADLQEALELERNSSLKQREMFEKEHEQLTSLVDDLQLQLKTLQNVVPVVQSTDETTKIDIAEHESIVSEFAKYKEEQEKYKAKWEKERDTLQMHVASLNTEYSNLFKEMSEQEAKHEAEIRELETQISAKQPQHVAPPTSSHENGDALSIKENMFRTPTSVGVLQEQKKSKKSTTNDPKTLGATATEEHVPIDGNDEVWCGLCEQKGHGSIECNQFI